MKNNFETLCEKFGVHKQVKREFYPRQIQFSPEFLVAVEEEFQRQNLNESEGPINNHRMKFLKALNFHLRDIENGTVLEQTQAEKLKKEEELKKKSEKAIETEKPKVLKRNVGLTERVKRNARKRQKRQTC